MSGPAITAAVPGGIAMKRSSLVLFMMIASLLLQPVRGFTAEQDDNDAQDKPSEKDLCLLYVSQCGTTVQSLQDKITRLQEEIAKGTKVYTPEELELLRQKLEEANKRLDLFFDK
jgi:hypothetical protein